MRDGICDKIALFCDVEKRAVVPMVTSDVLYEVPLLLEKAGVGDYLVEKLGLKATRAAGYEAMEETGRRRATAQANRKDRGGGQIRRTAGCLHVRPRGAETRGDCQRRGS